MNDIEKKTLQDLLNRAEQARQISEQINCLNGYDDDRQRQHLEFRTTYNYTQREKYKWPEEYEVRSILELGRQTKIKLLQETLKSILGVSVSHNEGTEHAKSQTITEENNEPSGVAKEDGDSSEKMQEAISENAA